MLERRATVVIWDKAGERILEDSIEAAVSHRPGGESVFIYKNNSDGKGNSYGCHENYLVDRKMPFPSLVKHLIPVLRHRARSSPEQGRWGPRTEPTTSTTRSRQRADFFEVEVGLETTFKRPIINTRDEPHADPERLSPAPRDRRRRQHVRDRHLS